MGKSRAQPVTAMVGLVGLAATSCVTVYTPTRKHLTTVKNASVVSDTVLVLDGPRQAPSAPGIPYAAIFIKGKYRIDPNASLGLPSLTPSTSPPCSSGGVLATAAVMERSYPGEGAKFHSGAVFWAFPESVTDQRNLFRVPTSLDIVVTRADGRPPECLRLPIVDGGGGVEWERNPSVSLGYGADAMVLFHRIHGVAETTTFALRVGPWIGPLRLQGEVGIGGAFAEARNPNLFAAAYQLGVRADTLLFASGHFGVGVAAAYGATAIRFGANSKAYSNEGEGFQGWIHGPRVGLVFDYLAQEPIGPTFRRRPDGSSASFEIYGASEWGGAGSAATPALWLSLIVAAGM